MATGSLDDGVDDKLFGPCRHNAFNFQLGSLTNIDRENKKVVLGELYDKHGEYGPFA